MAANNYERHVQALTDWLNESPFRRKIWDETYKVTPVEYFSKMVYKPNEIGDVVRHILSLEAPYIIKHIYGG